MNRIFYLAYYDLPDGHTEVTLAATNKMDYIVGALTNVGYAVDIVSASSNRAVGKTKGFLKQIKENVTLKTFDSDLSGSKIKRFFGYHKLSKSLKRYLSGHIAEGDTVLIYHSLGYYRLYKWLKHKLKAKVVLEVEEIYTDVGKTRFVTKSKELKCFANADAYLFPTALLDNKVNTSHKPSTVIHGTYCVETDRGQRFNDDKIHVVYAGTFDPRKGGALAAAAAGYLSKQYHVHILGFGSGEDKKNLINTIDEVSKKSEATVTYDGLKSGEDYIRFIQSCQIGLSTQNPNAAFNATSFPSKILSYMANGLRVVSIRIPAIEQSAIGDYMYYYDEQTPEKIAEAIMKVNMNDEYDGRAVIKKLDTQFEKDLAELLKKI